MFSLGLWLWSTNFARITGCDCPAAYCVKLVLQKLCFGTVGLGTMDALFYFPEEHGSIDDLFCDRRHGVTADLLHGSIYAIYFWIE